MQDFTFFVQLRYVFAYHLSTLNCQLSTILGRCHLSSLVGKI